jgi:hypothetical protein
MQYLFGEAVIWLIEGRSTDLEAAFGQHGGEDGVHAFGVELRDMLVAPFVSVFVPDGHAWLFSQV